MHTEIEILPQVRMYKVLPSYGARGFSLLLGAGASVTSGVPTGKDMIRRWRVQAWQEECGEERIPAEAELDVWAKRQPWYEREVEAEQNAFETDRHSEYSLLFERLYHTDVMQQAFIAEQVQGTVPGWGYLYLACIMQSGFFNITYTTNFDDLIHDALTNYVGTTPVVVTADEQVSLINPNSDRIKVVKLHGDYLFPHMRNTVEQLRELGHKMAERFRQFSEDRGLIAIGYHGNDRSVMNLLLALLQSGGRYFSNGVYWGVRDEPVSPFVRHLAERFKDRFFLFRCPDFDAFMGGLHAELDLELPGFVVEPYSRLQWQLTTLLKTNLENKLPERTTEHQLQLKKQLADLPLVQAQWRLAKREYKEALLLIEKSAQNRSDDPVLMTTWGQALAIQAEETGDLQLMDLAADKWEQAVRFDAAALAARRGLMMYYQTRSRPNDAVAHGEAALERSPQDTMVRVSLVGLYLRTHRPTDALAQADALIQRFSNDPSFNALRADVLFACGRLPEALIQAKRTVDLEPNNSWFHLGYGNILFQSQRFSEAEYEFREALRLDERNSQALLRLGMLLAGSGRFGEFPTVLDRLRQIDSSQAKLLESMVGARPPQPSIPWTNAGYPPGPSNSAQPMPNQVVNMNAWWKNLWK